MWVDSEAVVQVSGAAETVDYFRVAEPLCTDDLSMGLMICSNYEQEISSVYQFIDVLYNLRS